MEDLGSVGEKALGGERSGEKEARPGPESLEEACGSSILLGEQLKVLSSFPHVPGGGPGSQLTCLVGKR